MRSVLCLLSLVSVVLALAGCGGGSSAHHNSSGHPDRPTGPVVARVGGTPITVASYRHWMAVAYNQLGVLPGRQPVPQPPRYERCVATLRAQPGPHNPIRVLRSRCAHDYALARSDAIAFLVRAQWLLKEGAAHGVRISSADLGSAVSEQIKQRYPAAGAFAKFLAKTGMTRADFRFSVQVNMIADRLQAQSTTVPNVSTAQVASYYRAHPETHYSTPPRRLTLVVVTRTRAPALRAKAALRSGQPWARVAKRYSEDSSKLVGGAFAVVPGIQNPRLVHAVFSSPRGVLEGPVATPAVAAIGGGSLYYVYKVTGAQAGTRQSLVEAASQIKRTLVQQRQQQALAHFTNAYTARWRARTHCSRGYVVHAVCGNAGGKPPKHGT